MKKPLWFEINGKEFEKSTGGIYNNQENNYFKIIINKITYDLKKSITFQMGVTTGKITKSESKKLYNKLIQKDIDALTNKKLMILENIHLGYFQ